MRLEEEEIDVSLLVDVGLTREVGGLVASADDVLQVAGELDDAGRNLAESLFASFWKGKGEAHELN